jgi:hypothetical protein
MKWIFTATALSLLLMSPSEARQQTVSIQFDGLCDTITLTKDKALLLYASSHVIGCVAKHVPSSNPIPGVGILVKRPPGNSHARDIAVTDTQRDDLGNHVAYITRLEYPLTTGGAWTAYATSDGATITQVGAGTYTVK